MSLWIYTRTSGVSRALQMKVTGGNLSELAGRLPEKALAETINKERV